MKIGWIGIGVMGKSMVNHLLKKGHSVLIYTRTKAKAEELISAGAIWAESASSVASLVDCLFLMTGYPKDVESLLYNEGVMEALKPETFVVDHSTNSPALT